MKTEKKRIGIWEWCISKPSLSSQSSKWNFDWKRMSPLSDVWTTSLEGKALRKLFFLVLWKNDFSMLVMLTNVSTPPLTRKLFVAASALTSWVCGRIEFLTFHSPSESTNATIFESAPEANTEREP